MRQHEQQDAEREEEQIDRNEGEGIRAHVLAGLAECLAGEVFLHDGLVQTGHDDNYEGSADELFPEVLRRHEVGELEDPCVPAGCHGTGGLTHGKPEAVGRDVNYQCYGGEHGRRLERVGDYQSAYAAAAGIEPYQQHERGHGQEEGYAVFVEHETLQDDARDVEFQRRSGKLRQQEEGRARLVGTPPYPRGEQRVDRRGGHTVIKGQQDEGYDEVADDEAEAGLQVGHVLTDHHSGHGDERDA